MNTYLFIVECEDADIKEMKRLLNGKATIRKTKKLHNATYFEEFECWCGHTIYALKTNMELNEIITILKSGNDLHYAYQTINTKKNFTGNRIL